MAVVDLAYRHEYRSPARAEPDGVFQPQGRNAGDYRARGGLRAGDLVTWDLGGNVPHIGIVVDQKSRVSGRYMIEHNIGRGPQIEDVLFNWKLTGHYRYYGPPAP